MKKGVQPFIACIYSGLPPSDLHVQQATERFTPFEREPPADLSSYVEYLAVFGIGEQELKSPMFFISSSERATLSSVNVD